MIIQMNDVHDIGIRDRFHVLLLNKFLNLLTFYSPHERFCFPYELCAESHNERFLYKTMIN